MRAQVPSQHDQRGRQVGLACGYACKLAACTRAFVYVYKAEMMAFLSTDRCRCVRVRVDVLVILRK
eukprot:17015-Eustigmatos_ZCMA.PRE.1